MKICWVKILTAVASGSTDAYVVSPLDSGYKRAHAQSVCTGPFSRIGRGLGTGDEARVPLELTFRPHKVDSQIATMVATSNSLTVCRDLELRINNKSNGYGRIVEVCIDDQWYEAIHSAKVANNISQSPQDISVQVDSTSVMITWSEQSIPNNQWI